MSAIKRSEGNAIDYVAGADVESGDIVEVGDLRGVAVRAVAEGELGALAIEGVYAVPSAVTGVGTPVLLRETQQDAVEATADEYDGIVVGVESTGVALVKLERGQVNTIS